MLNIWITADVIKYEVVMKNKDMKRRFKLAGRMGLRKIMMDRTNPLEERMVYFVYITMFLSNFVIILMNIADSIPFYKNFKWMGFMLFLALNAYFYWKKIKHRRTIRNISFIIILFILFPALYFFSGGLRTAAIPYMIILLLALVYSFTGRLRTIMVIAFIAVSIGLMGLFYIAPYIFPYVSDDTMYLDWIMNFPVLLIIISIMAIWISAEHKYERDKALKFSKEMEDLSRNDTLTGIYNRRYLDNRAKELEETEGKVWLFIFDIDRFKKINDSKGHAEGDRILVSCAKIMTNVFQGMTSIRFGGDEFLVIATGDVNDLSEKIKRFRRLLEWELDITISGGVALYKGDLSESLSRGDAKLYQAKQAGRNKVIVED